MEKFRSFIILKLYLNQYLDMFSCNRTLDENKLKNLASGIFRNNRDLSFLLVGDVIVFIYSIMRDKCEITRKTKQQFCTT